MFLPVFSVLETQNTLPFLKLGVNTPRLIRFFSLVSRLYFDKQALTYQKLVVISQCNTKLDEN